MHETMEWLNDRHFIVLSGGKTWVGMEKDAEGRPIPLELITPEGFKAFYRYLKVPSGKTKDEDGNERITYRKAAEVFLESPVTRHYRAIVYDPAGKHGDEVYNLWRGFAVEPRPGEWGALREHIWANICRKDPDLYEYVLGWMAFAVQHPDRPAEVALVMRGPKGTGKGTLANAFGRLFGKHFVAVSHKEHLTGRFNGHLEHTSLLFVDEGFWAGDRPGEGVLKQLITEPYLPIERKYHDLKSVPNCLHVIMASNEDWVVPAKGLERRFCVLDVDDAKAKDTGYFKAIWDELNNGGFEAMLHDLLERDLEGFNIRNAPSTAALREQMLYSLDPFEQWWYGMLQDGKLAQKPWGEVRVADMYRHYKLNCQDKHLKSKQQLGASLRKLLPEPGLKVGQPRDETSGSRPRTYFFPPLTECRAEWDRQHGIETNWQTGDYDDDEDDEG